MVSVREEERFVLEGMVSEFDAVKMLLEYRGAVYAKN